MKLRLSLAARFTVLGLIIVAITGFFMNRTLAAKIQEVMVNDAMNQAVTLSQAVLSSKLTQDQLTSPMEGRDYEKFDEFIRENVVTDEIHRVKLWSRDGVVTYSDKRELVGRQFPVTGKLARSLNGEIAGDVVETTQGEHTFEKALGKEVVEIYVPVRLQGSEEVAGSYEVYVGLAPIVAKIAQVQRSVMSYLFLGLISLYVMMVLSIVSASRRFQRDLKTTTRQLTESIAGLKAVAGQTEEHSASKKEAHTGEGMATVTDLTATIQELERAQSRLAELRKQA